MADIILGTDIATNKPVTLKEKDYALGGYFIGVRRVGKSYLLEQLILQSINNRRGVCVIDPHGDLIENVIGRLPQDRIDNGDVILLDPLDADGKFPFGLNLYKCEDKTNPRLLQYTIDSVMHLFEKLWPAETIQPMVEDVVRVCAATIIVNDMTMVEIPRLILDRAFRNRLLSNVTNSDVLTFWESFDNLKPDEQERQGGVVARRVRKFTTNEIIKYIVGQSEKSLDFSSILNEWKNPKIVLVRLYADMSELTSLIGSVIVGQLLQAALSRSSQESRPEFHLYCDEYSRFATSDFSTIISEAGKYNIIPYIAHQSRGQITEENQDSAMQLGLQVVFRVIGKDAYELAGEFDCTPPASQNYTIPSDVLYHLTDHPNPSVKQFEQNFVRRLLEAKSLSIKELRDKIKIEGQFGEADKTEDVYWDEYPKYEFFPHAGIISFDPETVRKVLRILEHMLYSIMTNTSYDPNPDAQRILLGMSFLLNCRTTYLRLEKENMLWGEKALPYIADQSDALLPTRSRDFYEITNFGYFYSLMIDTVRALRKEPIRVRPSTEITTPQNFNDRRNEIANDLASLHQRTARIKVNRRHEGITEHTITTIDQTGRQNYKEKRIQVVEYTRANYCKTRTAVEEEIRRRQTFDSQPSTKRKHTL